MIEWLATTKLGRMLIAFGGILLALGGVLTFGLIKGAKRQASKDAAHDAQAEVDAVHTAQQTYVAADAAAAQVEQTAKQQPAPDTVKRDDFQNTF